MFHLLCLKRFRRLDQKCSVQQQSVQERMLVLSKALVVCLWWLVVVDMQNSNGVARDSRYLRRVVLTTSSWSRWNWIWKHSVSSSSCCLYGGGIHTHSLFTSPLLMWLGSLLVHWLRLMMIDGLTLCCVSERCLKESQTILVNLHVHLLVDSRDINVFISR